MLPPVFDIDEHLVAPGLGRQHGGLVIRDADDPQHIDGCQSRVIGQAYPKTARRLGFQRRVGFVDVAGGGCSPGLLQQAPAPQRGRAVAGHGDRQRPRVERDRNHACQ